MLVPDSLVNFRVHLAGIAYQNELSAGKCLHEFGYLRNLMIKSRIHWPGGKSFEVLSCFFGQKILWKESQVKSAFGESSIPGYQKIVQGPEQLLWSSGNIVEGNVAPIWMAYRVIPIPIP